MSYVITTRALTKYYSKKKKGVKNITFTIESGEIFALLGLNGAGKTTIINMLLGLSNPTSGSISYMEKNFSVSKYDILKRIGSVVETPGFYKNLTVYDNLKIVTNIVGFVNEGNIDEVLQMVGLFSFKNIYVKELNIAQKQKLAIARALVNSPEILVLDEPLNGLDHISINEIRNLLLRLAKEKGITILLSSHVLDEVEKLADRICIIHEGEIIEIITKNKVNLKYEKVVVVRSNDVLESKKILNLENIESKIIDETELNVFVDSSKIPQVLFYLVRENIKIIEIYKKRLSLEEYFIQLINEKSK